MIAAVTAGWLVTKASAISISVIPACVGERSQRVRRLELGLVAGDRHVVALREHLRAPALAGRVASLAVSARQPAAGERAPRDHAHPLASGRRAARRPRCGGSASSREAARRRSARGRASRRSTAPARSRGRGRSSCRCSAPCRRARGRSAPRASRRCRCRARDGGPGRGRSSRFSAGAGCSRPL